MSNKEKMPKTVNEGVQKYRVSLSEEKKAIVRAKDNSRKKEKRQIWKTEDNKKYENLLNTEKKSRQNKKAPFLDSKVQGRSTNSRKTSFFRYHMTKSRSINKVKLSLPRDKNQCKEVLWEIISETIEATPENKDRLRKMIYFDAPELGRSKALNETVKLKIKEFLKRNDISAKDFSQ